MPAGAESLSSPHRERRQQPYRQEACHEDGPAVVVDGRALNVDRVFVGTAFKYENNQVAELQTCGESVQATRSLASA